MSTDVNPKPNCRRERPFRTAVITAVNKYLSVGEAIGARFAQLGVWEIQDSVNP
jgi:hypothetical protein